jgi:uncharacterized SAM-binding protein YcdF (DUF218 family)
MQAMQRGSLQHTLARGQGQFVWRFGVVCFGGLYFLATAFTRWVSIAPWERYEPSMLASLAVISAVYSLSVGTAFGFAAWYLLSAYERLARKRPEIEPEFTPEHAPERLLPKSRAAFANK